LVVGIEIIETFFTKRAPLKTCFSEREMNTFVHSFHYILVTDEMNFVLFRGFREESAQVGSGFGTVSGMVGE